MADQILLYISAAEDLDKERDILGRSVTELPVELGWLIRQSPRKNELLDEVALSDADVHLLLIGGDIRAPIGLEWLKARWAGRQPVLFLKRDVPRTPAAQDFIRFIGNQSQWEPFSGGAELRFKALSLLSSHIVDRATHYALSQVEVETLLSWRSELNASSPDFIEDMRGGAGESGLIYSTERYMPSDGILIEPAGEGESDEDAS